MFETINDIVDTLIKIDFINNFKNHKNHKNHLKIQRIKNYCAYQFAIKLKLGIDAKNIDIGVVVDSSGCIDGDIKYVLQLQFGE